MATNLIAKRLASLNPAISKEKASALETALYDYYVIFILPNYKLVDEGIQAYIDLVKQLHHELGKELPTTNINIINARCDAIINDYAKGGTNVPLLTPFHVHTAVAFKQQNQLIQEQIDALSNITLEQVCGWSDEEASVKCKVCGQMTGRTGHKQVRAADEGMTTFVTCSNPQCLQSYPLGSS